MGKRGFQPRDFDQPTFEGLCKIQCTEEEIAQVFGTSPDSILKWIKRTYGADMTFPKVRDKFAASGRASLRRYQFNMARTNPSMAIWLGKQYLGQTDVVREEHSIEDLGCLADLLKIDEDEK